MAAENNKPSETDEPDISSEKNSNGAVDPGELNSDATPEAASEPGTPAPPPPDSPRAKGGRVLGSIALLLALGACTVSGYLWYRVEVQQKLEQGKFTANLSGGMQALTGGVAVLEKQQEKLSARQDEISQTIDDTVKNQLKPLHQQQADLTQSVQKVYETLDRSLDSWALEEVEQLLNIANHSVLLSGNIRMGLTGLELADARLRNQGNPKLLEVRRQVSQEINQLKAVKQVDIAGIALRLASMHNAVAGLAPATAAERALPDAEPVASEEDQGADWAAAGQELLADLKSLVRIQNVSTPAQPLLKPEEKYFLTANLQLLLSGAQMAALRSDTGTFRTNLEQAGKWIKQYFDNEQAAVQSMLKDIAELSAEELAPDAPDISGSLKLLQEIKSRMKSQ